jgi:hypothetical protein
MSLSTSSQDESTSSSINMETTQIEKLNLNSSDDGESLDEQSSVNAEINGLDFFFYLKDYIIFKMITFLSVHTLCIFL